MVPQPFAESIQSENPNAQSALVTIWLVALVGTLLIWICRWTELQVYPTVLIDTDNLMRLVQAKDLLAGQGWYDPVQYRLGLESGTIMHWSRLIDAPIAAAIFIGGESFALFAWPFLLSIFVLAGLSYGAFQFGGRETLFPTIVAGFGAMWGMNRFWYGQLDHHNMQIALLIWCVVLILPKFATARTMALAGIFCALMLAVGVETLPHVAAIGIWVSCALVSNIISRKMASAFAYGITVTSLALVPVLLPYTQWANAMCDSFSIFQVTLALIGGCTLLLATTLSSTAIRLGVLGLGGLAAIAAVKLLFPACLENPFADLPPLLRELWLDQIVETQSIVEMFGQHPLKVLANFGLTFAGICVCITAIRIGYERASAILFLTLIVVATMIAAWQIRGIIFATMLSIIPLAVAVTIARDITIKSRAVAVTALTMVLYTASFAPIWSLPGHAWGPISSALLTEETSATEPEEILGESRYCYDSALYAVLRAEPTGVVLSSTNVGPKVLAETRHRAIAGPYHRNVDGIMFQIETMTGSPDEAKQLLATEGVTHIADCVNGPDAVDFTKAAPDGFQAQLIEDHTRFEWLELLPETADTPLRIFRVVL
ncbi:MAG: hypothetical protein AAFR27_02205 [Pseudomonadota bacterium]